MTKTLTSLCILFLSTIGLSRSQNIKVDAFESIYESVSKTVYYVFQDSKGYIWFATDKGVVRYNGRTLNHYTTKDGLSDNEVFEIHEDSKQRIWFLTHNGKACYWYDFKFYQAHNDTVLSKIDIKGFFRCFFEDSNGNIWLGTDFDGVIKLDTSRNVEHYSSIHYQRIIAISEFQSSGVVVFAKKYEGISYLVPDDTSSSQFIEKTITVNKNMELYVHPLHPLIFYSIDNELHAFNYQTKKLNWKIKLGNARITSINIIDDQLWVGSLNGFFTINTNGIIESKNKSEIAFSSIIQDNEGNKWFSTLGNGVFVNYNLQVKHIPLTTKSNKQNAIISFQNNLIFGNNDMVVGVKSSNQINYINLPPRDKTYSRTTKQIQDIYYHFPNETLISTDEGLFSYKESNIKRLSSSPIKSAVMTIDSTLYLSTSYGTFRLLGHEINKLQDGFVTPRLFRKNRIAEFVSRSMLVIDQETILFGSNQELCQYNFKKKDTSRRKLLLNANVKELFKGPDGRIWIVTADRGVYFLNENLSLDSIPIMLNNDVQLTCGIADRFENIWLGSNTGLHKYNLGDSSLTSINRRHGLESNFINDMTILGDTLWIAHDEGISGVPLNSSFNYSKPKIYLESFYINGRDTNYVINLSAHQNHLKFIFDGVSLKDKGDIAFQFNLKGEQQIQLTNKSGIIEYAALNPGTYLLEVDVTDSFNNTSEKFKFPFVINPPWTSTSWFRGSMVLLLALLIYFAYRINLISYNKEILLKLIKSLYDKFFSGKYILVKSATDSTEVKIQLNNILWIKAMGDYVQYQTENKRITVRSTLKDTYEQLASFSVIFQVHKSYLINYSKIQKTSWNKIYINGQEIPIGRTYQHVLKSANQQLKNNAIN